MSGHIPQPAAFEVQIGRVRKRLSSGARYVLTTMKFFVHRGFSAAC